MSRENACPRCGGRLPFGTDHGSDADLAASPVRDAVRNDDPDTSSAAWADARVGAAVIRVRMVGFLFSRGVKGACLAEVAIAFGVEKRPNSISPRFVELEGKGLIVRTKERRRIAGHSAQIVWIHRAFAEDVERAS
jgi:hypothetical protein